MRTRKRKTRMGPASKPATQRFWEKVDQNGPVMSHMDTNCWVWTASTASGGYGQMGVGSSIDGTKRIEASHRLSYQWHVGDIPKGRHVLHDCDNRLCVRPDHLYLGTPLENARDREQRHRVGGRIPDALVVELRAKYGSRGVNGWTVKAIAEKYGLPMATVWRIVAGVSYRHVA